MSLIQITDLTFCYDGSYDNLFEGLSIQLDTDWKLGLIGRNGRGKTTLLQLLMGKYEYRGEIRHTVLFEYFPYPVEDPEQNALELMQQLAPDALEWQLMRELSLLKVAEEVAWQPFGTLSQGERTKVLLAVLFLREDSFLLIDEPTNHLDLEGRRTLSRYLNGKRGFILVSHDRAFLDGCIDHVLSINRTGLELQRGNFSSWQQNRERQDAYELTEHQRLQREVKQLKEAARRTAGWSQAVEQTKYASRNSGLRPDRGYIGHKSAKMMKRAKTIEQRRDRAIEEKSQLLQDLETTEPIVLRPLRHPQKVLVQAKDLCLSYGERTILKHLDFEVRQGERVVLRGRNGSGKSSILKLILGQNELAQVEGSLSTASGLICSCVWQDTSFLQGSLRDYAQREGLDESLFKAILRKLDFPRSQFEKELSQFSGGQKKKVLIAASLCRPAHLFLWDEPLNFIDLLSRMQIEEMLLSCQPTMLFVEHDEAFADAVATKVVELD